MVFTYRLMQGVYWQVPLKEETKKFTAFVTPFDVYEYNRLPFGWKNSGSWFQKMMNETKISLEIFAMCMWMISSSTPGQGKTMRNICVKYFRL